MSYLKDYLKVIPKVDADRVRENITENQEIFSVQYWSEQEFEALVNQLVDESEVLTNPLIIDPQIQAEDFNTFYSHVAMDLNRLFPEQNYIEGAGENYDRVFQGHIEELQNEVDALRRNIEDMEQSQREQTDVHMERYSFEPETQRQKMEDKTEETAYLFKDRDGKALAPAETNRLFHTYFLSLAKTSEENLLTDANELQSADVQVLYESPYSLINRNENYTPDKMIDGDSNTFWLNIALKPDNGQDSVSISPRKDG